jgi:hypothetical protein
MYPPAEEASKVGTPPKALEALSYHLFGSLTVRRTFALGYASASSAQKLAAGKSTVAR